MSVQRLTWIRDTLVKGNHKYALYKCTCGAEKEICKTRVNTGTTKSCGCLSREVTSRISTTHGMSFSTEYFIYRGILARCNNPKNKDYNNYGGRGIKICKRWEKCFENFYEDMENRPSKQHSINRGDNNKNYSKSNCNWATQKEQQNNRRSNKNVTYKGRNQTLTQWCEELNLAKDTTGYRLRNGWSVNDAFEISFEDAQKRKGINKRRMLAYKGESHSISEWGRILEIPSGRITARINTLGWSIEKALSEDKHINMHK